MARLNQVDLELSSLLDGTRSGHPFLITVLADSMLRRMRMTVGETFPTRSYHDSLFSRHVQIQGDRDALVVAVAVVRYRDLLLACRLELVLQYNVAAAVNGRSSQSLARGRV